MNQQSLIEYFQGRLEIAKEKIRLARYQPQLDEALESKAHYERLLAKYQDAPTASIAAE